MMRIVELRPDDTDLRVQIALQLATSGDHVLALGHYKAALEKNAIVAGSSFADMVLAFERAAKARS